MKRVYSFCIITCLVMCLLSFGIHSATKTETKQIKVGFIFVGDEITPYTKNFMKARDHVIEVYGDQVECVTKYNVTEDQIEEPLNELVEEKCDYMTALVDTLGHMDFQIYTLPARRSARVTCSR